MNGEITQRDEPYSTFASEDLLDILELGIGARAMLVRNINTDDGLVNGAFGTITGLEKSSDNIIKAVYIRFDHPYSGKNISPSEKPRTQYQNIQLGCLQLKIIYMVEI